MQDRREAEAVGMIILDCSSQDSTYDSLAQMLARDRGDLERAIESFELVGYLDSAPQPIWRDPSEIVLDRVVGKDPDEIPVPDVIHWFHATRVLPGTDFSEGIQPLGQRIDPIRSLLEQLAGECLGSRPPRREQSRAYQEGGLQLALKASDPIMGWGPYAYLVRDAILHPDDGMHDYLDAPEAVEDLCGLIAGDLAQELLQCFREATRPCIVEFRSSTPRDDVVAVALYYLYAMKWRMGHSQFTNTSYDGRGRTVPREDIVDIEFLDDEADRA